MESKGDSYTTISLPIHVKEILQVAKGDLEWGEYLISLYNECSKLRKENAYKKLKNMLGPEIENIEESSGEIRKIPDQGW